MSAEETELSSSGIGAESGRVSDRAGSGLGRPHGVNMAVILLTDKEKKGIKKPLISKMAYFRSLSVTSGWFS